MLILDRQLLKVRSEVREQRRIMADWDDIMREPDVVPGQEIFEPRRSVVTI